MQIMMKSWWLSLFRKFTLPCSSQHMFLHMEFFSLLCSVAAGSRGHWDGWGAPLFCLHSVLGKVGSKTGPSSLCLDFQQRAPSLPGALTCLPMACWTHSAMVIFLQFSTGQLLRLLILLSLSFWQQQDKLSYSSPLQSAFRKETSLCTFCLLNWEKEQYPKPWHLLAAWQWFRQAQILSPPYCVIWEYHYNSARFRQQYFLSVLALEDLLLLDTHQVVNGKFGNRCGNIYKNILAIFLLLPESRKLIIDLEKGLHFLLTRAQSPDLLILSAGLFLIVVFPETGTENVTKVFPRLAC